MQIYEIQKLTLLDYPEKISCMVFTPGCQFRCPFCHNASLAECQAYDASGTGVPATLDYLKQRRHLLEGVCVSGGEPLLQLGMEIFLTAVKEMGLAVKLDTNGMLPGRLAVLLEKGLIDMIAMDVKNCKERYAVTCGVPLADLAPIIKSIRLIQQSGVNHEFRMTVVKEFHDKQDMLCFSDWEIGNSPLYLQYFQLGSQCFRSDLHPRTDDEMAEFCQILRRKIPNVRIRGNSRVIEMMEETSEESVMVRR